MKSQVVRIVARACTGPGHAVQNTSCVHLKDCGTRYLSRDCNVCSSNRKPCTIARNVARFPRASANTTAKSRKALL